MKNEILNNYDATIESLRLESSVEITLLHKATDNAVSISFENGGLIDYQVNGLSIDPQKEFNICGREIEFINEIKIAEYLKKQLESFREVESVNVFFKALFILQEIGFKNVELVDLTSEYN